EFATLLEKSGKFEKSISHYRKALNLCVDDDRKDVIHFRVGNLLSKVKNEDVEALTHYAQALSLNSNMAEAWHNAGTVYLRCGSNECALSCFIQALKLRRDYPDANYNVATVLRRLNRQSEAVRFSWNAILDRTKSISKRPKTIDCSSSSTSSTTKGNTKKDHLTVVCVKWGTKYDSEYVLKLFRGVKRHLSCDHKFVCFTDDDKGLRDVDGVTTRTLTEVGWTGWWNKATLFSSSAKLSGRIMFVDLDTVIVSSLDSLTTFQGLFSTLGTDDFKNEGRLGGLNSSVMLWNASSPEIASIFERLQLCTQGVMKQCIHRFDHWLEMNLANVPRLQDLFPGVFVEYAQHCTPSGFPTKAAVINFPLKPKPHEVKSLVWMKEHWV
ncbi:tetratricopeptide repeat protein, partial [bacterium]|nr:tetratricopeptide repeat protein [bacterium]